MSLSRAIAPRIKSPAWPKATFSARLAVDVGGTFTDVVLENGDRRFATKVLTTPEAPERAILDGTRSVLGEAGLKFTDIGIILHGTTLATNAIIERKGAKTALIATEGFRDVIEIADESRYDQYDLSIEKPKVLVPRRLRFTVPERVDVEGGVRLALDETAVLRVAKELKRQGVEAVAVAFLHSYINPAHERRVGDMLGEICPDIAITLSSEVCPEMREYERTSTAIANAYVQPLMAGYLGRLETALAQQGYSRAIHLMTSGGNLTSLATAQPVSSTARGVRAGGRRHPVRARRGRARRAQGAVVRHGRHDRQDLSHPGLHPFKASTFEVDRAARFLKGSGLPVRIPVIEMVEIGAGGGSIADDRRAETHQSRAGERRLGAGPGLLRSRRHATPPLPTPIVVLGRIDVEGFAGGMLKLAPQRSGVALDAAIGDPLKLSTQMAAYGVVEIVDENMSNAARVHAVERGVIIAEHTLVAFGGAAPLHAARLAEKLGIDRIIVPRDAGVGSAMGFLEGAGRLRAGAQPLHAARRLRAETASALLTEMSREARALAEAAAGGRQAGGAAPRLYALYGPGPRDRRADLPLRMLNQKDIEDIRARFEADYRALFERHIPGARIEILSWSVLVTTSSKHPSRCAAARRQEAPQGLRAPARCGTRTRAA